MEIYEPREDSFLLQEYVEKYTQPDSIVLDMGTGTGIQALTASKKAKKVIAVDINSDAVKTAKLAADIEKVKNINFIKSDLFQNVPKTKFELIIFNPPYLPKENIEDKALFSGKRGTKTTIEFLNQVFDYMKDDGKILLISSSIANQNKIKNTIKENLLQGKIIAKTHIFFEDIVLYEIKKADYVNKLPKIKNPKMFARGRRGFVIKAKYKGKTVSIKLKKSTTEARNIIANEANFLRLLNKHKIGPKLIGYTKDYIMYEFVEGDFIFDFLKNNSKKKILVVLKKIFAQLRIMDKLKINKFEMHRPIKHIIIKNTNPVFIDFERCRYVKEGKNVTQFCDFIIGKDVREILKKKSIHINKEEIIKLAKKYKKNHSEENYKKIIDVL